MTNKPIKDLHRNKTQERKGVVYPDNLLEVYWFIEPEGEVFSSVYFNDVIDKKRIAQGNAFWDKESAEYEARRREVKHRFNGMAAKAWRDAGTVINWSDTNQCKTFALYNHEERKWVANGFGYSCQSEGITYFPSKQSLMDAIEALDKDERYLNG